MESLSHKRGERAIPPSGEPVEFGVSRQGNIWAERSEEMRQARWVRGAVQLVGVLKKESKTGSRFKAANRLIFENVRSGSGRF